VDLLFYRVERASGSVSREKREPQAGPASCLSNSASKGRSRKRGADQNRQTQHRSDRSGEVAEGLPGSKSVARAEGDTSNEGGPEGPCRLDQG